MIITRKRLIKKLEERIEMLERTTKQQDAKYELTFNFKNLFGWDVELITYKKENDVFYYLKRQENIFTLKKPKVLTPEFKNETELMIYIINNFEEIKKEKENE